MMSVQVIVYNTKRKHITDNDDDSGNNNNY